MVFTSCHENINHKLQMADECLDRNSVDSAYNILNHINPENLNGDENIALYTLLNTKTKYIKYIPVKNDSIDYAIFYYKQNGPEGRLAEAYNYKAMTLYFDQGKKEKAIEFLKKAETIALKTANARLIQKIYDNIFTVNFWNNHYNIALEYGFKALNYARKIKDTASIAYDLLYISNAYSELNMDNKSIEYYLKAFSYYKYYNKLNQTILLGNIGDYYFEKGDSKKAEVFINKAIQKNPTAYIYSVVADIYIKKGKYAEAEEVMGKAPKTTNHFELLKKLSTLYNLNRKLKNYVKALNIADSIIQLNKKINYTKEHDNLNDIQAKYDREIMAQKFKSQIIYMIGALLLLSLLIILLIFRQKYRNSEITYNGKKRG